MPLDTKSQEQLERDQSAAIQSKAKEITDFSVGSIMRAWVESNAFVGMWLQAELQKLLAITRASTSKKTDLDSWMADFSFTREPAVAASGNVVFSRYTSVTQQSIAVGGKVQKANGTSVYTVIADTTNPAYNSSLNAYVANAGISDLTAKVQADVAGIAGNAGIGEINTLASAFPGFDTVTNTAALNNGEDIESDEDFRARFIDYLAGLAKASVPAIRSAIENVQTGIEFNIVEFVDYATGTAKKGYFYTVIDDGSGTPSPDLLQSVYNAVDATRACGIQFENHGPETVTLNVTLTVTKASGADSATVKAAVEASITNYINNLGMGAAMRYSRIDGLAYDSLYDADKEVYKPNPDVSNVTSVLLNGATADIIATPKQAFIVGTVTATVV
jgi:uncharacterized phage protein gp47/JayE